MGRDVISADPLIRVTELRHVYADGRLALRGVSFTVTAGERVGLVGPNGAGKTTLFLRLCGVLAGRRGEVSVAGLDPADPATRPKLPAAIGVVFQNPDDQLFAASVLDDVAFGPLNLGQSPTEAQEAAETSLAAVGLAGFGDRSPHKLSGGEKRRAAIAGVLAMRPAVYLLDEPSVFLDPRGRRDLAARLRDLPGTILLATHDLDLVVATCGRVIVLDDGQIIADGPTAEVLADPAVITAHGLELPHPG